jgi:NhaA family Na+:H+ antiporter
MAVPALIYAGVNAGTPEVAGWGIPMATDIAFSLGILALLGKGVPVSLKVFLTALAIVDDLGAVMVIAIFYTSTISFTALAAGLGFLAAMALANCLGTRAPLIYFLLGACAWLAFLLSGVHATIAGVLAAMTIPARQRIDHRRLVVDGRALLDEIERTGAAGDDVVARERRHAAIQALDAACEQVETPLQRLEHRLHPWVAFFIMPVFALANAGVPLGAEFVNSLTQPVTLGVVLGLVIGKQLGVTAFSWIAVRAGWARLPAGVNWSLIYGVSWLAGVGFTMSLFITSLAFNDEPTLIAARSGVLIASLVAGVVGYLLLKRSTQSASLGN